MRFQRILTYVLILSMALPLPGQFGPPKPPPGSGSSSWGFTIFPFTLVLLPLMLAWAVDHMSRPNDLPPERRRGTDPVLVALCLLVGFATISVIATHADWRHACMWLWLTGLYAFARYRMPRIIGRNQLAVALAWVMVGLALVSAVQFATGRPVGAVATLFQHQVRSAQVYSGKGGGGILKRVQGTFFSTDVFAMFLLYVVIWFVAVTRTVEKRLVTLAMLGSGVLIALTFSRGVWGSSLLLVPWMMMIFIRRRQLRLSRLISFFSVLVVAVAITFVLAAGTFFARLSTSQVSTSAQTRDTATKVGVCLAEHRWAFGVGYSAMALREDIANCNTQGNDIRSHNIYVQDWAEQGVFTMVSYLAVGLGMLYEARRKRAIDDPGNRAMRTGVAFMIFAWLIFMAFYATANDYNVMPIWILLGGYSLTLLDTSHRMFEPLGGPAPLEADPRRGGRPRARMTRARLPVAIVHDYLTQRGGAERVVLALARAFPGAPIHTSFYEPATTFPEFEACDVRTMPMNRVGILREHHRLAFPLLAPAFSLLKVDADVAVCSSTGWAHGARVRGRSVVYCHSPARWLWVKDQYLPAGSSVAKRAALAALERPLRRWDVRAAHRADRYLVNSSLIRERVQRAYGIDAEIVPPPFSLAVDGPRRAPGGVEAGFFLCVARLLPYKNVRAVVEAFADLPAERLVVVGTGPEGSALQATATANVRMVGAVTDEELVWLYANAVALVAPSYEDFGITPLEAAGFGIPVAALRWGGFLDTVREGETGVFFDEPTAAAIGAAVQQLRGRSWDRAALVAHAATFSEARFVARLQAVVEAELGLGR